MFFKPILLPLLAQVLLTYLVWVYMYYQRISEIRAKRIDPQALDTRAHGQSQLTASASSADNLKNLFEMPVLFYVALVLSMVLMIQDGMLVALAWAFVLLRALHSLVHCTYNQVMHRFGLYIASSLMLLMIWIRLATYILSH
jgi:hypothetical protein